MLHQVKPLWAKYHEIQIIEVCSSMWHQVWELHCTKMNFPSVRNFVKKQLPTFDLNLLLVHHEIILCLMPASSGTIDT
jgi:hypothetical protein